MDDKELLKAFKVIQDCPSFRTPCPRCGANVMDESMVRNALSRHEDVYVCSSCGMDEAILDSMKKVKPLSEWYIIKLMKGTKS